MAAAIPGPGLAGRAALSAWAAEPGAVVVVVSAGALLSEQAVVARTRAVRARPRSVDFFMCGTGRLKMGLSRSTRRGWGW